MRLSSHELGYLALRAGFSEYEEAPIMVAIILAQTEGESDFVRVVKNEFDMFDQFHGLAAINSRFHSDMLMGSGHWRDPVNNMEMAHRIFKESGNNFTYWESFTTNMYKKYLPIAHYGVENPIAPLANLNSQTERNTDEIETLSMNLTSTQEQVNNINEAVNIIRDAVTKIAVTLGQIRRKFSE